MEARFCPLHYVYFNVAGINGGCIYQVAFREFPSAANFPPNSHIFWIRLEKSREEEKHWQLQSVLRFTQTKKSNYQI